MLSFTRKVGERIVVGDGSIVITLVAIKGSATAKIGIQAPKSVPVDREEIRKLKARYSSLSESKTETIVWNDPSQCLPDKDTNVLLHVAGDASEPIPIWPGYLTTGSDEQRIWLWANGGRADCAGRRVVGWANLPGGKL